MKKIVLIVDDLAHERAKALEQINKNKLSAIAANNLTDAIRLLNKFQGKIYAVVTDLHYPSQKDNHRDINSPNGLALVSYCVENNIRVGVCSNVDGHFSDYVKHPLKLMSTHQAYQFNEIPFSNIKNWEEAINETINL